MSSLLDRLFQNKNKYNYSIRHYRAIQYIILNKTIKLNEIKLIEKCVFNSETAKKHRMTSIVSQFLTVTRVDVYIRFVTQIQ